MSWTLLLLLACPLMMLFCMKGMSGEHKKKDGKATEQTAAVQSQELDALKTNMTDLMEQNHKLSEELKALKASESKPATVVPIKKDQTKREAL
ncbi:DUF2933 domain-containing protein [Aquibacillus sp. 3ASR75-11]|uniref:DUF2933 domain-containing protein n=1 Tax=Terrihalobacillus insolitus TaxID=2950438 RepID=A0A9X3WUR0_9BACI|nr:DUF2933 domain-containing protein [Terrihalobacillus insolitus]MDC3413283.1 DUF2933 domain-containing protein [Terrihalobacillus insolitus]MDC3426267.1 DUF2933 domain-containing protein [Terrihalobacillus insolitus]